MKIEKRQKLAGLISVLLMLINLIRHFLFLGHALSYRALWGTMVTNLPSTTVGEWIYVVFWVIAIAMTVQMARRPFLKRHRRRLTLSPPSTGLWIGNILAAVLVFLSAVACSRSDVLSVRVGCGLVMWFNFLVEVYFLYISVLRKKKGEKILRKRRQHR